MMKSETTEMTGRKGKAVFIPVGGTVTVGGRVYECCEGDEDCLRCAFCMDVCIGCQCGGYVRQDGKTVYFREVSQALTDKTNAE